MTRVSDSMQDLLERRARKGKDPKSKMESLTRWLKGATPAIKSYSKAADLGAKRNFEDPQALAAMKEVARTLQSMEKLVLSLHKSVPKALRGLKVR